MEKCFLKLLATNYVLCKIYINIKNKRLIGNTSTRSQIWIYDTVVFEIYNRPQISVTTGGFKLRSFYIECSYLTDLLCVRGLT